MKKGGKGKYYLWDTEIRKCCYYVTSFASAGLSWLAVN